MNTKYEIGEEVLIKGKVAAIVINGKGLTEYRLTGSHFMNVLEFPEDDIECSYTEASS